MNTKTIKLDINKKIFETITAKQGDTKSRFILFNLYDGPIQFDLTGRTVRVYGEKKDNTTIFNDLVINEAKKGYCTLELTNQMLAVEGMSELELVIFEGEKRLSTMPFILNVVGSKYSEDAIASTNEFTALSNALKTVGEIDNKADKKEVEKISSQLETKANDNEVRKKITLLSMSDMGQDVKSAMTGGSVAVVGNLGTNICNLANDTLNILGEFIQVALPINNGFYPNNSNELNTTGNYINMRTKCTPNEVYSVTTYGGSIISYVQFFNEDGTFNSNIGYGQIGFVEDYVFVVPSGATEFVVMNNNNANSKFIVKKYIAKNTSTTLDEKLSNLNYEYKLFNVSSIEQNKIYNHNNKNGLTLNNYNTYFFTVAELQELYITTKVVNNADYSIAMFFDNDGNYIGDTGYGDEFKNKDFENYKIKVPFNCTKIGISCLNSIVPSIKEKIITFPTDNTSNGNIFVSFESENLHIKTKYDNNYDLCINMCKRGGNNLFEFNSIFLVSNNGDLNNDITQTKNIINNITDWFSPYMMNSVNNGDGDKPSGYYSHFVGGNHEYTNTGSGGTPTARTSSIKVHCDGEEVINNHKYCSNVEIIWTNYIQGCNTKKADGTGREILKETIKLSFDSTKFEYENNIEPLEDLTIEKYYGLQTYNNATNYNVKFIGGSNRKLLSCPGSFNSVDKSCNIVKISTTDLTTEIGIDNNVDLGKFELNTDVSSPYSCFTTSANKTYFNIIRGSKTLKQGDIYTLRGYYKFYKTI